MRIIIDAYRDLIPRWASLERDQTEVGSRPIIRPT
jgi:hypothetical protein